MMRCVIGAMSVAAFAGAAMAGGSTFNGLNFNSYENFRNAGSVIPSMATLDGNPVPVAFNGSSATGLGAHSFNEIYPMGSGGFANRHILWASSDGGATAHALQAGESFLIEACFRMTTNHPTGVGAPINSETGIWIHNPRVGNDSMGNPTVNFIDEGGIWAITNGTSFAGGAGQDFTLFGEGGFNNPNVPPIAVAGNVIQITYEYFAADYFGPGSMPSYSATVRNLDTMQSVSSGLKGFNSDALGRFGLNPGTTFGFRMQNQVFPVVDTNTTTDIFHIRIIPGPGGFALLGLGGLLVARRRR